MLREGQHTAHFCGQLQPLQCQLDTHVCRCVRLRGGKRWYLLEMEEAFFDDFGVVHGAFDDGVRRRDPQVLGPVTLLVSCSASQSIQVAGAFLLGVRMVPTRAA